MPKSSASAALRGGINRRASEAQAPRAACCGYVPASDVVPASVAYHQAHKAWHVAQIPTTTPETVDVLDTLILQAERALGWSFS